MLGGGHDAMRSQSERGAAGALVWFKQPAAGPTSGTWEMAQLFAVRSPVWKATPRAEGSGAQGPDFLFRFADIDGDGVNEVIAAQYYGAQLSLAWCTGGNYGVRSADTYAS